MAYHSKRLHAVPFICQEIRQCVSLQLTITSPPSQVCLGLTFALLFTASPFTLRLIFVKRYGSASLCNRPSHHLHHKNVLGLPSHCFSQQAPSRFAFYLSRDMAFFQIQLTFKSPPSEVCLELTFALLFRANALTLRLIFVKRYGSASVYNSPSHHLHHKFVLS